MQKVFDFLKTYWLNLCLLLGILMAGFFIFRGDRLHRLQQQAYDDMVKQHEVTIKTILEAQRNLHEEQEANRALLERRLLQIEADYQKQKEELDAKKKEQTKAIVQQYKGRPRELAQEFAKTAGIEFLP